MSFQCYHEVDVLPKAKLGGCLPKSVNFVLVTGLDELIVDDQEIMSRNIVWERREREAWHCEDCRVVGTGY